MKDPSIVGLEEIGDENVGGKAAGLARMHAMGLRVPTGFVILDATPESLPSDLLERYRALGGGSVAVRSSALDEDGNRASFAGQYETLLNVEGEEALVAAVRDCLSSLSDDRADVYRASHARHGELAMCVVVQRMVDPRAAGVLFTADPVTHRRARVVIDAVSGLGEALVSGQATPDHNLLERQRALLRSDLVGDRPILESEDLDRLVAEALQAEAERGEPLDLEWAIDRDGQVWWLQARPITTLGPDPNELDTPTLERDHVYTRCNVGEMFPGVCTPLSYSFTAWAIDVGMQRMHLRVGVQDAFVPAFRFLVMSHGHLFLNLTTLSDASSQTFGGDASDLTLSICGRSVTEPKIRVKPPPAWPRRARNVIGYFRYLAGQRRARRSMKTLVAELEFIPTDASAQAMWHAIDDEFEAVFDAMDWHLVSSATAGIMTPIMLGVLAKGEPPSEDHHVEVAGLLAGAQGVESADIADGATRIVDALQREPEVRARFLDADDDEALAWLSSIDAGTAGREFRAYLERHGHRAIKELDLRQPEWQEDSRPLVASLKVSARSSLDGGGTLRRAEASDTSGRASKRPLALRLLTRLAHQTVRSREETKSGLVAVTARFKQAYRELARRMVREDRLPDEDAVFFLMHEELGALLRGEGGELAQRAVERRSVLDHQAALQFEDIFLGEPVPIVPELPQDVSGHHVTGTAVSRGRVVGVARVVRTPTEAESLMRGEILVAPITDVGWTPYFSMISGLVTDIGSAVSHGAVVAREFGLPAVVNTRFATQVFKTGDRIVLDADHGHVRLASVDD